MDIPWYKDVSILTKNMDEFLPSYGMTTSRMINAITRLLIYIFILNYFFSINIFLVIFCIIILSSIFIGKNNTKENFDSDFNDEIPVKNEVKDVEDENKIPINSQSIKELQMAGMNINKDPYNVYAGYKYMNGLNGSSKKIFEQRRISSGNFSGSPKYSPPPLCNYLDEKSMMERTKFFSASRRNFKN